MQYNNNIRRFPTEQELRYRQTHVYPYPAVQVPPKKASNNSKRHDYKATTKSHEVCAFCNIKKEIHDYGVCYSCYSLDRMVCVCCKGAFKDISKSGLQADGLCKECTKEALDINCGRYTRFNKYKIC